MKKIIIAAVSKNNVISNKGKLPWHSKKELEHFKKTTTGFPVIMGRKTWETLKKPLPNRINIILSKNQNFSISDSNIVTCNSLNEAFDYCNKRNFEKIYIIGGGEIFSQSIDYADEIILSEMNFETEGDKYFVNLDINEWIIQNIEYFYDFKVIYYKRKKNSDTKN